MKDSSPLVQVAVDAPLWDNLTYSWPPQLDKAQRGQAVFVPLGQRKRVRGVVVQSNSLSPEGISVKDVLSLHEEFPPLPENYLKWMQWLSNYYLYPLGQILSLAFPPLKKRGRGSRKGEVVKPQVPGPDLPLTKEQSQVLQKLNASQEFQVHLLHGVTGSGKTEVYMEALKTCLERGQRGLVLVPEISLTPQLIQRFSARFPNQIAVLHSHLTEREKTDQWWSMVSGEKKILIGARSALFCPIEDLGLIVIDEEHEPSFKQDEKLRYHARDAAIMLAKTFNCPILLGSATPSIESWWNAQQGRYQLLQMRQRVKARPLPRFHSVDLKDWKELRKETDTDANTLPFWLTPQMHEQMQIFLKEKKQVALFLNRRGIAQSALCQSCGHVFECPNCAISLTLHGKNHLVCHYCDYTERLLPKCKACGEETVEGLGLGTELVENDLRELFPEARIARADRDEIQSREHFEELIDQMMSHQIDILIGTQMIAKGLDFPNLNFVGLVLADVGFHLPDFRASERSFQLLTQMGGRSGRHSAVGGEVLIQTYNPQHPAIEYAISHDYEGFVQKELEDRRELLYPPFSRLALIKIQGSSLDQAKSTAEYCKKRLELLLEKYEEFREHHILGPAPAPLAKIRNKYRFHILIKSPHHQSLNELCRSLYSDGKWVPRGCKVQIDIDPMNML